MIFLFFKPAFFLVLGLVCTAAHSQGQPLLQEMKTIDHNLQLEVTYKLDFILDSTNLERRTKSINILSIGESTSVFECLNMKRAIEYLNQIGSLPSSEVNAMLANFAAENRSTFRTMVLKSAKNETLTTFDMVFADSFEYEEEMGLFDWVMTGREKTIMGYRVLEATTTYACRNWVALFAPDVPISDGPYKFHGLPGLILKIADTQGHYVFEIDAIEIPSEEKAIEIPLVNWNKTDLVSFIRLRSNFHGNANPYLSNQISDPQSRAQAAARFSSLNNFIELCAD